MIINLQENMVKICGQGFQQRNKDFKIILSQHYRTKRLKRSNEIRNEFNNTLDTAEEIISELE